MSVGSDRTTRIPPTAGGDQPHPDDWDGEPAAPADWSGHGHGAGVVGCPDCDELDD